MKEVIGVKITKLIKREGKEGAGRNEQTKQINDRETLKKLRKEKGEREKS
jgi:hypothetical protein